MEFLSDVNRRVSEREFIEGSKGVRCWSVYKLILLFLIEFCRLGWVRGRFYEEKICN